MVLHTLTEFLIMQSSRLIFRIGYGLLALFEMEVLLACCRILCYNAGLEDPSKLGEPEREYIDEILGRIYAIAYSPKGRYTSLHADV